ncbi:MAG: DNA-processing protein DprA, partial [Bacteroidota bacterium]
EQVIADLSKKNHDPIIVSGLAYGIDIQAHREALKNKLQTIAVLGHGFNHIYPPAHRGTAREITHRGAVVTEFTSDTKPDRQNFIKRNRLIAGLADATLVIESAEKGGALITADIAHSYNREVLAVPGRSNDRYSAGCNKLIKTNKAALIESAEDIEKILNWDLGKKSLPVQKELFHNFSEEEELIIAIIRESGEVSMDDIAANSGLPVQKVSSLLFNLDMDGIIQCMPGKIYRVA